VRDLSHFLEQYLVLIVDFALSIEPEHVARQFAGLRPRGKSVVDNRASSQNVDSVASEAHLDGSG
jgi:hypothetical protein